MVQGSLLALKLIDVFLQNALLLNQVIHHTVLVLVR